ncbi:hypothetical protein LTSEGIV_3594 [Salmonella enterica subsp. enterica serovar Give str. S5-487]|nr:hypothetical protein LTSEGIV_3594 [Salmonella enterica subsp. enterica serovar Give str. S5-487]
MPLRSAMCSISMPLRSAAQRQEWFHRSQLPELRHPDKDPDEAE